MSKQQEALRLALEALETVNRTDLSQVNSAITALREALADYLGDRYHDMTENELEFFRLGEAAHGITGEKK